jgi:hypothetical protein
MRGTVEKLQRALETLKLGLVTIKRDGDAWVVIALGYFAKHKRLEDALRSVLRQAAKGGKPDPDPRQLSLTDRDNGSKVVSLSLPSFRNDWTIESAQDYLEALADDGVECPCCGQNVKLYRRKLYTTIARQLIMLWHARNNDADGWVHASQLNIVRSGGGDLAKARYWGLVEAADKRTREENSSGLWRITDRGIDFVERRWRARKYVLLYNGRVVGFDGEKITIVDALGDAFSYQELMRG